MATSSPIVALLYEPSNELKEEALKEISLSSTSLWPIVADHLPLIEGLFEDPKFPARGLAGLVASKLYYHLGDFTQAVEYALASEAQLQNHDSLGDNAQHYVETIVAKAVETYIEQRQAVYNRSETPSVDATEEIPEVSKDLEAAVESLLSQSVAAGKVTMALGVALEARRLDLVVQILSSETGNLREIHEFVFECCIKVVSHREFRNKVLRALYDHVRGNPTNDEDLSYVLITKIMIQLDDASIAVALFEKVIETQPLIAYQVAFDLVASASQQLLANASAAFTHANDSARVKLVRILSGVPSCDYEVSFLQRHNNADMQTLDTTRTVSDPRHSMFHSAVSFQAAFLLCGTTHDKFFRQNVEWLNRAHFWTKFVAAATLGVVHKGNLTQGYRILRPYLAKGQGTSAHSRGGALYGLGLVFAGFGAEVLDLLQKKLELVEQENLSEADEEERDTILHGACLGAGLAAMRTSNFEVYNSLQKVLYTDSATSGEAAGLAMGLVMLGSRDSKAENEMLMYARDTEHSKIVRSLGMGISLLNYGKEEESVSIINTLLAERDSELRYGGCFTIAMAYAGTGNKRAIKQLLHTAVSDASDNVRRAAVIALGFVLVRTPESLPRMVSLLSESHNPHVRYGVAMALGVAGAGSGMNAAVDMLMPMMKDPVDFVRQGAMIALAMVLIQHTDQNSRVKGLREHFHSVVCGKHEDAIAKFGAALALGIIDGGGCNATIQLENPQTGNLNMKAVVGIAVFLQHWYWFPLAHFMSLAFTPTTAICVKADLKIPKIDLQCNAMRGKFSYPSKIHPDKNKRPEQIKTAVLSTTMKDLRRTKAKLKEKGVMDIDEEPAAITADEEAKEKELKEKELKEKEAKEKDDELNRQNPFNVENMSRVLPWQRKYMELTSTRFVPAIGRQNLSGVIVVDDNEPSEDCEVIKTLRQASKIEDETEEAPVPQPFEVKPFDENSI